jgi:hypothetical protein
MDALNHQNLKWEGPGLHGAAAALAGMGAGLAGGEGRERSDVAVEACW